MIGRLEGRLLQVSPGEVILDVAGVGYLVSTTLRAYEALVRSDTAVLWIHTQVRDDAIVLFGFPERSELEAFAKLIGVAGVGPRTALAVLSALSPSELAAAVEAGDVVTLCRSPGVGRKTAERIQLELRGSLGAGAGPVADVGGDALSALLNLGYRQREAKKAVADVRADSPDAELGEIIRLALQRLTR